MKLRVVRMHSQEANEMDEYVSDPEESLDILERLRQEARALLYEDRDTFQRTVSVVRRRER